VGREPIPVILGLLLLSQSLLAEELAEDLKVRIVTNQGNITATLFSTRAPITVANFMSYVDRGEYDSSIFHRVVLGFMIQGGGYYEDRSELEEGTAIVNEADNGIRNTRGTLAMARMEEIDSATREFFINLNDNEHLDHGSRSCTREDDLSIKRAAERGLYKPKTCQTFGYAVFGEVIGGMDVVDEIELVTVDAVDDFDDLPIEAVVIQKIVRLGSDGNTYK
jgi:peptidyl-prolyl cis-trans isomerase A (cyclophilin A)